MHTETARMLTEAIADATRIAIDNHNRLLAFEKCLQQNSRDLFQIYLNTLALIRHNPPASVAHGGFANLQSKCIQDR